MENPKTSNSRKCVVVTLRLHGMVQLVYLATTLRDTWSKEKVAIASITMG